MKSVLQILTIVLSLAGVASAAEVQGILMDKMCSNTAVKQGQSFATKHDTKCALAPACARTGYGVFTADGKFISFDSAGNAKAAAALKATSKTDDLKVSVNGNVSGDTMTVSSLKLE